MPDETGNWAKLHVFCPTFCDFACFFVIFVLLNNVCSAEIKQLNDVMSDENTSTTEGTTKRYKGQLLSPIANFALLFALKTPVFRQFIG